MNKISIGVVDYDMGNHASAVHCLRNLGYRVKVSGLKNDLNETDVLILPGVGAFPSAMSELKKKGLIDYLREQACLNKPIIGICLGMQLLAEASYEHGFTKGLGLIPGEVSALTDPKWHIGWNTLKSVKEDKLIQVENDKTFYFNHSFAYTGSADYIVSVSHHHKDFASIIRKDNVIGLQFHPEKSQVPGRLLLDQIISGMTDA